MGVRTAALGLWDVIQLARAVQDRPWVVGEEGRGKRTYLEIRSWCGYAVEVWSRKRRTPMNVDAMVKLWHPLVKGLATAHSKEQLDSWEFSMDKALAPILTAPVAQIREFYAKLCAALEADETMPLFVWTAFKAWHEVILKAAPDEDVLKLKKDLAGEVADLVEADVRPDIGAAIRGALQWRSPEQLVAVRDAVKAGHKPRLKGRESCLFLCVPDGSGGEATVML